MALKPEVSLGMALATVAVTGAIFANALPSNADVRTLDSGNTDIQKAERTATWMSAGAVATISLLAKDPTIFTVGGLAVIGMAWWYRHSDQVDAMTQSATGYASKLSDVGNTGSGITPAPAMSTQSLNLGQSVI